MSRFHTVKLELIRPGPAHNQLLSPLTPYIALCGNESPVTFHIELEHRKLLTGLARLRYVNRDGSSYAAVPDPVREAAVREVGEDVARIFSDVPTLLAEISRARGEANQRSDDGGSHLAHLSLVLGGSELALIPFEMAFSPQSFPGEGLEFFLQVDLGTVVTRETRRSRSASVPWDRPVEPAVLMIASMPEGLDVPLEDHLNILRAAIEPWVRWPAQTQQDATPRTGEQQSAAKAAPDRLSNIKERVRLLINPSLEDIYDRCSQQQFTHIHILAHGDSYEIGGERRFGVALCERGNPAKKQVVSGKRLAKALQAESEDGTRRSCPLLVTLATCDSGNQDSVLIPGGSIAHDLHSSGIPWVFASQFPLTKSGSVRLARELYPRLLRGDDPRQILFELRRQLYMSAERDHDWASVVVYAAIPSDFDDRIAAFFERQTKRALEIALDRADDIDKGAERMEVHDKVMQYLALWESRLPDSSAFKDRARRAEYYGIRGATLKRIALREYRDGQNEKQKGDETLMRSLSSYRKAMDEWATDRDKYHWVATQALALLAALGQEPDPVVFDMAYKFAERDLSDLDGETRAWAHGTLAELELIRGFHKRSKDGPGASTRMR